MYLKSQLYQNLSLEDGLSLSNDSFAFHSGFTGTSLLTTTALTPYQNFQLSIASPVFDDAVNAPFDPEPLEQTDGQSALADFNSNLQSLETAVGTALDGVTTAKETAETIQSALNIFGEIADAADTIGDVLKGFENVLKLVGKVGVLRPFARKLEDVFDAMEARVRQIETKARKIDDKLDDEQAFVDEMIGELSDYEVGLETALSEIISFRQTIAQADAAYNRLSDLDAGNNGLEAKLISIFGAANSEFGSLDSFLNGVDGRLTSLSATFGDISGAISLALPLQRALSDISSELEFLKLPLNILDEVLSPVESVLDAAAAAFDLVVAPILNPILDALGITALFDAIGDALFALLPDTSGIFALDTQLSNIFANIDLSLITNLIDLEAFENTLLPNFLDPISGLTDDVIITPEGQSDAAGGLGNDLISGNDLDNTLTGNQGNDIFTSGQGDDIVFGGSGDDLAIFNAPIEEFIFYTLENGDFVVEHLSAGSANDQGTNRFNSVEGYLFLDGNVVSQTTLENLTEVTGAVPVTGDGSDEFFIGDSANNTISGAGGDDFLFGRGGIDTLNGGDGDDILNGGGDDGDFLNGGAGFDIASYAGQAGAVNVVLLADTAGLTIPGDLVSNLTSIEGVIGGSGDDELFGDNAFNIISGGDGSDVLRGLSGDDVLNGDAGQDFLFGDFGNDTLEGGAGDDFLTSGHGDDFINGGSGFDVLFYGGLTSPTGMGAVLDSLNYRAEAAGFAGIIDYIIFDGEAQTIEQYQYSTQAGTDDSLVGTDTINNIELIYGGNGDDIFTGSLAAESVVGGSGDDVIRLNGTLEGEDRFFAGGGNDTIYLSAIGQEYGNGGSGINEFIFDNTSELTDDYRLTLNVNPNGSDDTLRFSYDGLDDNGDAVTLSAAYGLTNYTIDSVIVSDRLTFIGLEDLGVDVDMDITGVETLHGTSFRDFIRFGEFSNGEADAEVFLGGVQTFHGGDGNDNLTGHNQLGGMTIYGEAGDDVINLTGILESANGGGSAFGGEGNDTLDFTVGFQSNWTGTALLDGGAGDDTFFVDSANTTVIGDIGNDTLNLIALRSGTRSDIHIGDSAYDSRIITPTNINYSINIVTAGAGDPADFGIENVIGSLHADQIQGSEVSNRLFGATGNDIIYGHGGDDYLFGGGGVDSLFGGDGNDVISIGQQAKNNDFNPNIVDGGEGIDTLTFQYFPELTETGDVVIFGILNRALDGRAIADLQTGLGSYFYDIPENNNNPTTVEFSNIENLTGGYLNDQLFGNNITNTLIGGGGDDFLDGREGDDFLIGGLGDDQVFGGAGNDTITAGRGSDAIDGGQDTDILDVSSAAQGGTVNLALGIMSLNHIIFTPVWSDGGPEIKTVVWDIGSRDVTAEDIFYASVENFRNSADVGFLASSIFGFGAWAVINPENSGTTDENGIYTPGLYEISLVESVETSFSRVSNIENVNGGQGDDIITGSNDANELSGNGGNDILRGGFGDDILDGGEGDDIIYGDTGLLTDFGVVNLNIGGSTDRNDGTAIGRQTDYLAVDTLTGFDGEAFTIEMLYQSSEDNDAPYYFSYATENNNNEITLLENNGQFRLLIGDTATNTGGLSTDIVEDGALHRISLTYELIVGAGGQTEGIITLYVDGTEIYSRTTANRAIEAVGTLIFGQHQDVVGGGFDTDQILSGSVGDIRLWDSARSQADISANAFTTVSASDPDLLENWVFDSGAAVNVAGTNVMTQAGGTVTPVGTAGDDIIDGGAGDDQLFGGDGDDLFLSSLEDSDTEEEDPDNLVDTHDGADVFDGGAGVDTVSYENSSVGVTVDLGGTGSGGDAEGDTYISIERVIGTQFYDSFIGDAGDNIFVVTTGFDDYDGGGGFDSVDYSASSERILAAQSFENIELIIGSDLNDDISGSAASTTINAGAGADRIYGSAGADANNGGDGFDTVDYRGATSRVVFDAASVGTLGDALGDTYSSIERYYGSNFNDSITGTDANEFLYGEDGNDVINGGGGIDRIYGGAGNDVQRGGAGNDTLYGGAGSDQLNGGIGFDIANYTLAAEGIALSLAAGGAVGDAAGDSYFGIEAVYGTDFGDQMTGNSGTNELRGFDGDDVLDGAGGNDRLHGGEGADMLIGGSGIDSAYYTTASSAVHLSLVSGGTLGEADGDSFSSIEWVFGSDFDDEITGDGAANRIYGEDGDDLINGGGGNDRLLGGDGDDTINGGDGIDVIFGQAGFNTLSGGAGNDFFFAGAGTEQDSFDGGDGFDTVSYLASSQGIIISDHIGAFGFINDSEGDLFFSIERVLGTNFTDVMIGNAEDNIYFGYGGDDFMVGNAGNDSLFGGAGADTFLFNVLTDDADVIGDFRVSGTGQDIITLSGGGTDYDSFAEIMAVASQSGANTVFNFGDGNILTLLGVDMSDLTVANFTGVNSAEPLEDMDAFAADIIDVFDTDALI